MLNREQQLKAFASVLRKLVFAPQAKPEENSATNNRERVGLMAEAGLVANKKEAEKPVRVRIWNSLMGNVFIVIMKIQQVQLEWGIPYYYDNSYYVFVSTADAIAVLFESWRGF